MSGIIVTNLGSTFERYGAVAVQSDGKIVAVGFANPSAIVWTVVRYHADGTLDPSFGTGGIVSTPFPNSSDDEPGSLLIQGDGKIVAGGITTPGGSVSDFALARYNTDGSLDSGFGTAGLVVTDFGGNADGVGCLAIQGDGKILAGGQSGTGGTSLRFSLARYNTDGSLDTGFGTGGKVTTDVTGGVDQTTFGLAVQADGKIVASGYGSIGGGNYKLCLTRYLGTDGSLDPDFGTAGIVATLLGGTSCQGNHLLLQNDGKILVSGTLDQKMVLARFNTDGTLDTIFGTSGKTTVTFTDLGGIGAGQLNRFSDGRLLMGGNGVGIYGEGYARFHSDGSLDSSFGTAGQKSFTLGTDNEALYGLTLRSDEKILAAGYQDTGNLGDLDCVLVLFNEDGTLGDFNPVIIMAISAHASEILVTALGNRDAATEIIAAVNTSTGSGPITAGSDATTLGFFSVGPVAQAAAYTLTYSTKLRTNSNLTAVTVSTTAFTQTYATATHTHSNPTATSVVTTGATSTLPFGYAEAQANAIVASVNALIVDVANAKQVLNAAITDLGTNQTAVNALIVDVLNIKKVLTALVSDLQAYGLLQ